MDCDVAKAIGFHHQVAGPLVERPDENTGACHCASKRSCVCVWVGVSISRLAILLSELNELRDRMHGLDGLIVDPTFPLFMILLSMILS